MSKKLYIKTYGCQMNVYDSIKISDLLKPHGFAVTEDMEEADLAILNTCHIREKASEKVYSELGRVKQIKDAKKKTGNPMMIAVAGCVAQAEGEEIFSRAPYVDIVVGSQSYFSLPKLIEDVKRTNKWAIDIDFPENSKFDKLPDDSGSQGASSFLSIQEGCDKFCHFCVVPYTRGAEYSRPVEEIYREAVKLAALGSKEINLLGQNVSAYHGVDFEGQTWSLAKLLKRLSEIKGLERILYTTSHPRDMTDEELFEVHAQESKLIPYLHLPFQSGSNKILDAMNRKHTREFYLEIIAKFRAAKPDMAFSADIIIGYPGESDQDFADTMDLVKQVKFAQCYSFKYSPRPGTPASMLDKQVPEKIKDERLQQLQELVRKQQTEFNASFLGKTLSVLFDKPGKNPEQIQGKSQYMQAVIVEGDLNLIGQIRDVQITEVKVNSLFGKLV